MALVALFANVMGLIVLAQPASVYHNCTIHNGIETLLYLIYSPLYLSLSLNMKKRQKVRIAGVALVLTAFSNALVPMLPHCAEVSTTATDFLRDEYFGFAFACYFYLAAATLYEVGMTESDG
jgi:hypothetical protein